jgi:UDP-N-acetylmuramoyl-tripeptide--D-alanyl-D-alanine ligase
LDAGSVVAALSHGWSAPHRGAIVRAGGLTIIDDAYNASPASVEAALELLAGLPGRRIAVLGEMLELGAEHESGHERVGVAAAEVVDRLLVIGEGATGIAGGARKAGLTADRVAVARDRSEALARLVATLAPGDVVLVKASRGIALDLLVDDLRDALDGASKAEDASR